jgi:hypothetical protein
MLQLGNIKRRLGFLLVVLALGVCERRDVAARRRQTSRVAQAVPPPGCARRQRRCATRAHSDDNAFVRPVGNAYRPQGQYMFSC